MKVAGWFKGRWTSFFATTYSIELEFFDEYLFRRLGEPPVNATVLTDAGTHARLWASGDDPTRRLRRANRDYLLRPMLSGTGAFHPKTYLLANPSEGVLLVGSGNLTMSGIERGREVFSVFHSTNPGDVGSIRSWRQWMDGIVERLADEEVTYRWMRLRRECGDWLEGDTVGSQSQPIVLSEVFEVLEVEGRQGQVVGEAAGGDPGVVDWAVDRAEWLPPTDCPR